MSTSAAQHPSTHRGEEPIRVFKSDILEAFTHVHWITVPLLWIPVVLVCLVIAAVSYVNARSGVPWHILAGFVLGLVVWTFVEYCAHRFIFHLRPRTPWQERLVYLLHGIHHQQPHCKTRLVLPPLVSIPMAVLFFGLFHLVFALLLSASLWLLPVFAGFVSGYIAYDIIHYVTHHTPVQGRAWKYLKKHHMLHHFKTPNARYGVSTPFWDYVFGTLPS